MEEEAQPDAQSGLPRDLADFLRLAPAPPKVRLALYPFQTVERCRGVEHLAGRQLVASDQRIAMPYLVGVESKPPRQTVDDCDRCGLSAISLQRFVTPA